MILDFTEVINKTKTEKKLNFTMDEVKNVLFEGDNIIFEKPIEVSGLMSALNDVISLDVNLKTDLRLTCSRCLETFIYPISVDMHEKFTNNRSVQDDEIISLDSGKIDITEIIVDNILSALPIKKLCSDDCKGLCQHCGTNLNRGTCNCETEDVDLRLAALKDLFRD